MNCLIKKSLTWTVLLYMLTGGVYGLFWIMSRGYCVYFEQNILKKVFYIFVVMLIILYLIMLLFGPVIIEQLIPDKRIVTFMKFMLLPLVIVLYILISVISVNISKKINNLEKNKNLIIFLTLLGFLSSIYMQSRINKLG